MLHSKHVVTEAFAVLREFLEKLIDKDACSGVATSGAAGVIHRGPKGEGAPFALHWQSYL